jgi:hypothetical protein
MPAVLAATLTVAPKVIALHMALIFVSFISAFFLAIVSFFSWENC